MPVISAANKSLLDPGDPDEKFPLMLEIMRQGIAQVEEHFSVELTELKNCLDGLLDSNYVVETVLARRRPRGLGVEFSIVSRMDANALSAYFVASQDGAE